MVKFIKELQTAMTEHLQEINNGQETTLQKAAAACRTLRDILKKLNQFIINYSFDSPAEEIHFFKEIKPAFVRELIYYQEVYTLEANLPIRNDAGILAYFDDRLEQLGRYFLHHQEIYNYYRLGMQADDERMFLRGSPDAQCITEEAIEFDVRVSTGQSYVFARLQANEMFADYLHGRSYHVKHGILPVSEKDAKFKNRWTDSLTALIELVYALHARGSINNGKGSIKQIITDLELIFNVEVGNFYRTFQNMRIRKKNATPFLDSLKNSYLQKVEEY